MVLTLIEAIVFFAVLALTIYGFFQPLYIRYKLIRLGAAENRSNQLVKRIIDAVTSFFLLRCSVKKERIFTGLMHICILYGSLTFDTISLNHIMEGFIKDFYLLGHGTLGNIYSAWVDTFAILVLMATAYFIIRRYVFRPKSYTYTTLESLYIYLLLITVTLTFLLYEGSTIALHPEHAKLAYLGKTVAAWLPASPVLVKLMWWLHILNVFVFVMYVARSKYMHMFMGPINIAMKNDQPMGIIKPIDIENAEKFGITTFPDMTWKDLLDGFACVDCGRCEDYCPAAATDKKLSPKNIIIHLRDSLLKEGQEKLKNPDKEFTPLMSSTYSPEEIWACTTCGSCMQVCPVLNEQVPKILGLRQSLVLMEGSFPNELKRVFKGLTNNANPWGIGASNRLDWAKGETIPLISDHPDAEYLLFLGCAAAFDDRAQHISRKLIQFLNKHQISYALLGENETCCGETARRLGEEGIGQTLMKMNIEMFNELGIKKIITPCPHCFNTFKNEYPLLGGKYQIMHHSELILDLLKSGKIKLDKEMAEKITIHDSCYLGRLNQMYDTPREIVKQIPKAQLVEHARSKDHGFCCGAGGGMFWLEEKEPRINITRCKQLAELNPSTIATFCPYCLKMLDDGIKDLKLEHIKVLDIIEIIS